MSEGLPSGSLGCPCKGSDLRLACPEFGPGAFFRKQSEATGHPSVFKCYSKGKATAVLVGSKACRAVLRHEFDLLQSNAVPYTAKIVGTRSLRFCQDRAEHAVLRQLVGAGMTTERVAAAIPQLQAQAKRAVTELLLQQQQEEDAPICMDQVCQQYTLSIAQRLILGLELDTKERSRFVEAVHEWLQGLYRPKGAAEDSRSYLVGLLRSKIEDLENSGPDGSTVGDMLFAKSTDDDDEAMATGTVSLPPRKLTHDEVIDNSLLLILAGTDTSAGTLTAAMLLLGLHQDVWKQVVEEQNMVCSNFGTDITAESLEASLILDAVLKETLRLAPIVGGSARAAKESLTVAGKQIPKGWAVLYDRWLTHRSDPATALPEDEHMDFLRGFKPERWLSDASEPAEFIPFGVGPRYCLGSELGLVEMKVFLACMARSTDFNLVNWTIDTPLVFKPNSLVPCPIDGVEIKVRAGN